MLPQNYRLKNRAAFSATYRLKNVVADKTILLYVGNEKEDFEQQTKIGFVVSKKIHKRAVKRNRIKRLLREVLRLKIKNNEVEKINKYKSLIFIARPPALELDFNLTKNAINELLERL